MKMFLLTASAAAFLLALPMFSEAQWGARGCGRSGATSSKYNGSRQMAANKYGSRQVMQQSHNSSVVRERIIIHEAPLSVPPIKRRTIIEEEEQPREVERFVERQIIREVPQVRTIIREVPVETRALTVPSSVLTVSDSALLIGRRGRVRGFVAPAGVSVGVGVRLAPRRALFIVP